MKKTQIFIENGAFKKIPQRIKSLAKTFCVITDGNLRRLGEELREQMLDAELKCHLLILPAGEKTKSLEFVGKMSESLLRLKMRRDSCLIGLGGGVIGDLAGFTASIYLRGVTFVSVPTTLLAMCDSSIGGKTGIDLPEGKNLLGTFTDPALIIMDPLLLKNLPERDFRSGLAEIVKHGVIANRAYFSFLEKNAAAILARSPAILKKMIAGSVKIKTRIVAKDRYEKIGAVKTGRSRMLLNYGHTVGHALEQLSGYTLRHGEAVSIGMVAENRVAVGKNMLKEKDAERIEALLKKFHLPTKMPADYTGSQLKKIMEKDKKNIDGKLWFALPVSIGKARVQPL